MQRPHRNPYNWPQIPNAPDSVLATPDGLRAFIAKDRRAIVLREMPLSMFRLTVDGQTMKLITKSHAPAEPTRLAFSQMAKRAFPEVNALPFLDLLAPTLAAQNMNYGLAKLDRGHTVRIVLCNAGQLFVACLY